MNISPDIRAKLAEACKANALDPATIEALAKPAVRLATAPAADADIPIGATRLGGDPDLPEGVEWPTSSAGPMTFIAQIDLGEAHACSSLEGLPATGSLVIFYDTMSWTTAPALLMRYVPPSAPLTRLAHPTRPQSPGDTVVTLTSSGIQRLNPCSVTMQSEWTWPDSESLEVIASGIEPFAYAQVLGGILPQTDEPRHFLGGHPACVQGELRMQIAEREGRDGIEMTEQPNPFTGESMRLPADTARNRDIALAWKHVVTIDSDDRLGVNWVDCGMLQFWAHADSLDHFDRTWATLTFS
jgi:hypothetical protein